MSDIIPVATARMHPMPPGIPAAEHVAESTPGSSADAFRVASSIAQVQSDLELMAPVPDSEQQLSLLSKYLQKHGGTALLPPLAELLRAEQQETQSRKRLSIAMQELKDIELEMGVTKMSSPGKHRRRNSVLGRRGSLLGRRGSTQGGYGAASEEHQTGFNQMDASYSSAPRFDPGTSAYPLESHGGSQFDLVASSKDAQHGTKKATSSESKSSVETFDSATGPVAAAKRRVDRARQQHTAALTLHRAAVRHLLRMLRSDQEAWTHLAAGMQRIRKVLTAGAAAPVAGGSRRSSRGGIRTRSFRSGVGPGAGPAEEEGSHHHGHSKRHGAPEGPSVATKPGSEALSQSGAADPTGRSRPHSSHSSLRSHSPARMVANIATKLPLGRLAVELEKLRFLELAHMQVSGDLRILLDDRHAHALEEVRRAVKKLEIVEREIKRHGETKEEQDKDLGALIARLELDLLRLNDLEAIQKQQLKEVATIERSALLSHRDDQVAKCEAERSKTEAPLKSEEAAHFDHAAGARLKIKRAKLEVRAAQRKQLEENVKLDRAIQEEQEAIEWLQQTIGTVRGFLEESDEIAAEVAKEEAVHRWIEERDARLRTMTREAMGRKIRDWFRLVKEQKDSVDKELAALVKEKEQDGK